MKKRIYFLLLFVSLIVVSCFDSTEPDTTAPLLTFLSPKAGEYIDSVIVEVEVDDDDAVAAVIIAIGTDTIPILKPPFRYKIDFSQYPPGPLTVKAVAVDRSGNVSSEQSVDIIVVKRYKVTMMNGFYTSLLFEMNGSTFVIASNAAVPFEYVDNPGILRYTGETSQTTFDTSKGTNVIIGETVSIADTIDVLKQPTATTTIRLVVPKEYVYVFIKNNSPEAIGPFTVAGLEVPVFVPGGGQTQGIGYYKISNGASVSYSSIKTWEITSLDSLATNKSLTLTFP
jgi:hypothetical protein